MTVRYHRLRREHVAVVRKRRSLLGDLWSDRMMTHPTEDFVPGQVDLWELPNLRHILLAPATVDISTLDMRSSLNLVGPHVERWRNDHLNRLFERFREFLPPGASTDHLRLAVCVLSCSDPASFHCSSEAQSDPQVLTPMWHPEYLHHMCNDHVRLQTRDPSHVVDVLSEDEMRDRRVNSITDCYRAAWTSHGLVFNNHAANATRNVLDSLGMDPNITLAHDLDLLGMRVYCMMCAGDMGFSVEVFSWRQAVSSLFSLLSFVCVPKY